MWISKIISSSASSLYAIKILKSKGLRPPSLWDVTKQTAIAKMQYASSVWWGFLNKESQKRLDAIIKRFIKYSYLSPDHPSFSQLCEDADANLFLNILKKDTHVLYNSLPKKKEKNYDLRPRVHDLTLTSLSTCQQQNSFLNRMLFFNSY